MSYGRIIITRDEAVRRARRSVSAVIHGGTRVSWGPEGGRNPKAAWPWSINYKVDCSGAVAHWLGYDRLQDNGTWVNTTEMLRQARSEGEPNHDYFRLVAREEPVLAGDVLVFPWEGDKMGHTGLITYVHPDFKRLGWRWWTRLDVAHSSPSNERRFGKGRAVAITDARIWRKKGVIIRYTGFAGE